MGARSFTTAVAASHLVLLQSLQQVDDVVNWARHEVGEI